MTDFSSDSIISHDPNYVNFESPPVRAITKSKKVTFTENSTKSEIPANISVPSIRGTSTTRKRNVKKPSIQKSSISTPVDSEMMNYTLNWENIICFYGRTSFLSNFYPMPINVDGNRYFSVEHYYEAVKLFILIGPHCSAQLKTVKDPCAAKALSKHLISTAAVNKKRVEEWRRSDGIKAIKYILDIKFASGTELAKKLIDTGTALLAQSNPRDDLWAVNMMDKQFVDWMTKNDKHIIRIPSAISPETVNALPTLGKGKNLLGFLLMERRRQLQSEVNGSTSNSATSKEIADQKGDDEERLEEIGRKLAEMDLQLNPDVVSTPNSST